MICSQSHCALSSLRPGPLTWPTHLIIDHIIYLLTSFGEIHQGCWIPAGYHIIVSQCWAASSVLLTGFCISFVRCCWGLVVGWRHAFWSEWPFLYLELLLQAGVLAGVLEKTESQSIQFPLPSPVWVGKGHPKSRADTTYKFAYIWTQVVESYMYIPVYPYINTLYCLTLLLT